jgi:hypothetical protein
MIMITMVMFVGEMNYSDLKVFKNNLSFVNFFSFFHFSAEKVVGNADNNGHI